MLEVVIAVVFAFCLILFLGNFGVIVLACLAFGLLVGFFVRAGQTREDLKVIKRKLGITDPESDYPLEDVDAAEKAGVWQEAEEEEHPEDCGDDFPLADPETERLRRINQEIERELEDYANQQSDLMEGTDAKRDTTCDR
ncbi:hypothetical protein [Gorillibacterium timonense]|uniref:hypothetical protein n=1 Tax=Gorillibacterium timonense TaxID=1689269 RepID=UPI00071D9C2C|nr:hypothetical protein [Gorillibacterium timonense]